MSELSVPISILSPKEAVPQPPFSRRMLRKLFTPLTVIMGFGALSAFQFVVAAQGPTPVPVPIDPYQGIKETLSFLAALGTFLVFLVGVVWWVWKGRDTQQLKDAAAGWKDEVDRLRGDRDDARAELDLEREEHRAQIALLTTRLTRAIQKIEEMRKLNLRIQGWVEDEEEDAESLNSGQ